METKLQGRLLSKRVSTWLLPVALLAWSVAHAAPPYKVTKGESGDTLIVMDEITIEGVISTGTGGGSKVNCGDCKDGVYTPKKSAPPPSPSASSPPPKSKEQLAAELKQAADEAAVLYVRKIRLDDEPLENESMVVKWLLDKLKNSVIPIGPWGTVLDALEPTAVGVSEFDTVKDRDEMKRLRIELEAEESKLKREKEENAKLYEENMQRLKPEIPAEDLARGLASLPELNKFQDALVARARLRSDDFGYVVQQLLTRTRFDADMRMSQATYTRVAETIWKQTPSNVCIVPTTPRKFCVLRGVRKGMNCVCPNTPPGAYASGPGQASTFPQGSICRRGKLSADLRQLFPVGAQCGMPVNVSLNPSFAMWEYLPGVISER